MKPTAAAIAYGLDTRGHLVEFIASRDVDFREDLDVGYAKQPHLEQHRVLGLHRRSGKPPQWFVTQLRRKKDSSSPTKAIGFSQPGRRDPPGGGEGGAVVEAILRRIKS